MKKKILAITFLSLSAVMPVRADYFGLLDDGVIFGSSVEMELNKDQYVEHVDYDNPHHKGSVLVMQRVLSHDLMNPLDPKQKGMNSRTLKHGLTTSNDNSTVRTSSGGKGKSISQMNSASKKAQIERQAVFAEKRREQQKLAAAAAAKKRAEEKRRDDERAATVEMQTNQRLQATTNAHISQDYYNAGAGRTAAKQTARQTAAALKVGPQRIVKQQPKVSGQSYSASLKQQSQRDRTRRAPAPTTARKPVPAVQRMAPNMNGDYVFGGRATKTSIHIKRDPKILYLGKRTPAPRTLRGYKGFVLDPNAVVTTGRPMRIPEVTGKPPRKIPEPYTRVIKPKQPTHEEMMAMKIKEFLL